MHVSCTWIAKPLTLKTARLVGSPCGMLWSIVDLSSFCPAKHQPSRDAVAGMAGCTDNIHSAQQGCQKHMLAACTPTVIQAAGCHDPHKRHRDAQPQGIELPHPPHCRNLGQGTWVRSISC